MTVAELLDRTSSAELSEWRAYDRLAAEDASALTPPAPRRSLPGSLPSPTELRAKIERVFRLEV